MTATERREAIVQLLCKRNHETVGNIAFEFNVSTRTIMRDIAKLSLSYPVYTVPGKYNGGVYIADDYYIGKQYFTDVELQTIISLMAKADDDQKMVLLGIIKKYGKG